MFQEMVVSIIYIYSTARRASTWNLDLSYSFFLLSSQKGKLAGT